MKEINFSKLKFPAGLNLDLLKEILPEKEFRKFIVRYSKEKRKNRRIILPSHACVKKTFFHYLWSLVENGEASWEMIKRDFYAELETLKSAGISKKDVIKFYNQRQKEIVMEKIKKAAKRNNRE